MAGAKTASLNSPIPSQRRYCQTIKYFSASVKRLPPRPRAFEDIAVQLKFLVGLFFFIYIYIWNLKLVTKTNL